jgi:ABC-type transport system involved in multi-copper enzyme maturation permease subunit
MGRRALWLLLPVLLYLMFPVYLLIPDSWRAVGIAVVIAIIGLAVASLVTAGLAIFRKKERSVILIVVASLTFLLVVTFAVGEALGGH